MAALQRGYIAVTAANRGCSTPGWRHHIQILVVKWRGLEADPPRRHRPLRRHLPPSQQLLHPCPAAINSIHSMRQQTHQPPAVIANYLGYAPAREDRENPRFHSCQVCANLRFLCELTMEICILPTWHRGRKAK